MSKSVSLSSSKKVRSVKVTYEDGESLKFDFESDAYMDLGVDIESEDFSDGWGALARRAASYVVGLTLTSGQFTVTKKEAKK